MPTCEKDFTLNVATSVVPIAWWAMEELGSANRVDEVHNISLVCDDPPEPPGRAAGIVDFGFAETLGGSVFLATALEETFLKINPQNGVAITGWFKYTSDPTNINFVYEYRTKNSGSTIERFTVIFQGAGVTIAMLENFTFFSGGFDGLQDVWYFWVAYYDPDVGRFYIQIRSPLTTVRTVGSVSQSGDTITSEQSGQFSEADVNSMLKLQGVPKFYTIIAFINDTTVQVDVSATVAATMGRVFTNIAVGESDPVVAPSGTADSGSLSIEMTAFAGTISMVCDETAIFSPILTDSQVDFLWNNHAGRTYPF